MRKIVISAILALFVCGVASAEVVHEEASIVSKYDLDYVDGSTYTFCKLGPSFYGNGRIETSGSSATVTAVSGNTTAFASVAVGDEIVVENVALTAPVVFTVIAKASDTSLTADRAINIDVTSGSIFTVRTLSCGTTASDGWFRLPVGKKTVEITYAQGDLTAGVAFKVEGRFRGSYGVPAVLATGTLATASSTATSNGTLVIGEGYTEFRVGFVEATADTSDAGANIEQVSVYVSTERSSD